MFRVLGLSLVLSTKFHPIPAADPIPHASTPGYVPSERRARVRKLQEEKDRAWEAAYRSAPQRPRRERCESGAQGETECVWEGLQVSLADGEGLQACKDCMDVHLQGLYGE